ncbi:hypothetical protein ACS7SF_21685 (plasmid) [Ralstonia sp. 25C]|uniref:hypothetical protein n=1 Tax=Ralstonia sp. 25C TaxID=3447363 RepID=UPI003F7554A6
MHKNVTGVSRNIPALPSSSSPTPQTAQETATRPTARTRSAALEHLPAPHTSSTSSTSAPARVSAAPAKTKITEAELPLAAYLLMRAVDGRPVAGPEIARLRLANASVNETRQLLKHGRGNVNVNVRATHNESTWRMKAARTFRQEREQKAKVPWNAFEQRAPYSAAAASVFGAGNCGEHTSTTSVYHSRRLAPNEEVHYVNAPAAGHAFAESRIPSAPEAEQPERTVVMDAWAKGPAVLAADAHFAKRRSGLQSLLHYTAETGRDARITANDVVLEARSAGPAEVARRVQSEATPTARFAAFIDSVLPSGMGHWSEQHVIDRDFSQRVKGKLAALGNPAQSVELAARVAEQLGVPAQQRTAEAQRIVEAAHAMLADV